MKYKSLASKTTIMPDPASISGLIILVHLMLQDGRVVSVVEVLVVIQYSTSCQKWVHKKCSSIKGSMSLSKVMSFMCSGCLNPGTSRPTGCTSVDISVSANRS